jgi:hypothetical protein
LLFSVSFHFSDFSTYHSARAESSLPQNRHWKLDSQRSHQENLSLAFAAFQRRVVKSTQPSLAVKKKVEETGGVLRMSFSFNRLRSEVFYQIRLARQRFGAVFGACMRTTDISLLSHLAV